MKEPDKNNIHETFDGSVRYSAPIYQRYYVWGYEQLQVLLDDIENAADETSMQFIGATVVQDFGKKGGNKSPNEYLIIDGQQRLTTIYLLICGLAWCYLKSDNEDDAETLAQTYLSFSAGKHKGMPKLLPTIQDRKQLFDILEDEVQVVDWNLDNEVVDNTSRRSAITGQWKNIKKHFEEAFFDEAKNIIQDKIEVFQENLLNHIEYIQIILEPKDDANTAFSKLNFDGVSLAVSDLVRNDIFSRLNDNKKESLDNFYKKTWKKFEESFPLKSFDQYITIYSTIKFKGKYTKSKAFPELQKAWTDKKPEAIVKELSTYSDIYCALASFNPIDEFDDQINERLRRFSSMPKTTVTWPYILEILNSFRNRKVAKKQVLDCLTVVESFLVRRAIAGLEPTGLHAVFKTLWAKAGADSKKLKEKITTNTIRCPNDAVIKESLLNENMYSKQITKYLLIQRELHFNQKNGYDNAIEDFSVEHVLPRNRVGNWVNIFTKDDHVLLVNTIGNLVPLSKGQNSKIKDSDWPTKKNVFKGSNWKITQNVSKKHAWDEKQVRRNTVEFIKWASSEWKDVSA